MPRGSTSGAIPQELVPSTTEEVIPVSPTVVATGKRRRIPAKPRAKGVALTAENSMEAIVTRTNPIFTPAAALHDLPEPEPEQLGTAETSIGPDISEPPAAKRRKADGEHSVSDLMSGQLMKYHIMSGIVGLVSASADSGRSKVALPDLMARRAAARLGCSPPASASKDLGVLAIHIERAASQADAAAKTAATALEASDQASADCANLAREVASISTELSVINVDGDILSRLEELQGLVTAMKEELNSTSQGFDDLHRWTGRHRFSSFQEAVRDATPRQSLPLPEGPNGRVEKRPTASVFVPPTESASSESQSGSRRVAASAYAPPGSHAASSSKQGSGGITQSSSPDTEKELEFFCMGPIGWSEDLSSLTSQVREIFLGYGLRELARLGFRAELCKGYEDHVRVRFQGNYRAASIFKKVFDTKPILVGDWREFNVCVTVGKHLSRVAKGTY